MDCRIRLPEGRIEPTSTNLLESLRPWPSRLDEALSAAFADVGRTPAGQPDRERFKLALGRMEEASRSVAVLAAWAAIETFLMPTITNVKPINEALGRIYEIEVAEAKEEVFVGRFRFLRSSVVHDGDIRLAHSATVGSASALFKGPLLEAPARRPPRWPATIWAAWTIFGPPLLGALGAELHPRLRIQGAGNRRRESVDVGCFHAQRFGREEASWRCGPAVAGAGTHRSRPYGFGWRSAAKSWVWPPEWRRRLVVQSPARARGYSKVAPLVPPIPQVETLQIRKMR